jgi:hypothetical protein
MRGQKQMERPGGAHISPSYQWFILSGVVNAIVMSLFGPFTVKFLERLGGTAFHISLFNSLPGLVGVAVSLPGALWIAGNKRKNLKTLTAEFTLMSRLLVLLLIPLVWMSPQWAPLCCVLLLTLKNIPEAVSQTALQGLAGDMFSPEERSTAISQRFRLSVPATLAVSLFSGVILRQLPGSDAERLSIYQYFFILAALFGVLEVVFLSRMHGGETQEREPLPAWPILFAQIRSNRIYMRYVGTSLVYYFSWQMGWPLFSIYQVMDRGADELWLSIIGVLSSIGMFIGYRFWNKVIVRKGNAKTAVYTTIGMSLNPILMILFPSLYWLSGINLLVGFFTAGISTVLLNALLEVTPQQHRVIYVGAYQTLVNLSLAVSPIVAFAVLRAIGMIPALFVVSGLRLAGCFSFFLYSRRQNREMSGRTTSCP